MMYPELAQDTTIEADSSWLWPFAILLLLGTCVLLYRFCIIQTVKENGQVVVKWRWNVAELLASETHKISHRSQKPSTSMNPHVKHILWQVFNWQEIVFGVFVYCWGVCMSALAFMQLGHSPILLSPAHTMLCVVLGIVAMLWGVLTVVRRKRNNPFSSKDLTL